MWYVVLVLQWVVVLPYRQPGATSKLREPAWEGPEGKAKASSHLASRSVAARPPCVCHVSRLLGVASIHPSIHRPGGRASNPHPADHHLSAGSTHLSLRTSSPARPGRAGQGGAAGSSGCPGGESLCHLQSRWLPHRGARPTRAEQ